MNVSTRARCPLACQVLSAGSAPPPFFKRVCGWASNRKRGMDNSSESEDEAQTSFFLILHRLYSRILTSLQVAVDHLAEPETALQDLTTLHNQAH